mgnify:CR=1 FL=1
MYQALAVLAGIIVGFFVPLEVAIVIGVILVCIAFYCIREASNSGLEGIIPMIAAIFIGLFLFGFSAIQFYLYEPSNENKYVKPNQAKEVRLAKPSNTESEGIDWDKIMNWKPFEKEQ